MESRGQLDRRRAPGGGRVDVAGGEEVGDDENVQVCHAAAAVHVVCDVPTIKHLQ